MPRIPDPGGFLDIFRRIAAHEPSRPFARFGDTVLSFAGLDAESDRIALALRDRGVARGDRVAVMLPNSLTAVALIYAIAKSGAVWVPLNPQLVGDGLRHVLGHAAPRLVIDSAAPRLVIDSAAPRLVIDSAAPDGPEGRFEAAEPAPADDAAIFYTSGTTGPPKGVRVSHRMLRLAGEGVVLVADARDGDVMLLWEPLHHIGGAQMLVAPLLRRLVLHMLPRFSARSFWREVIAAEATHLHYLGGILQILLKQPASPQERAHRLRVAWGGGAPAEIWHAATARFGIPLRECYGMTEASSFSTCNADGTHGSVGQAMPWFDIALIDAAGAPVPQGQRGEIVVRARDPLAITLGYLDDPEANARALRDGALHTGDLGSFDRAGNLFFHGRMTDSVRVRGETIGAWEVEAIAAQHPDIADCAMLGVAAEIGEQEIKLLVQLRPGAGLTPSDLSAWLATRLARFQQPRYIAMVAEFERTPSQRIMKHRLSRATAGVWDRLAGTDRGSVA